MDRSKLERLRNLLLEKQQKEDTARVRSDRDHHNNNTNNNDNAKKMKSIEVLLSTYGVVKRGEGKGKELDDSMEQKLQALLVENGLLKKTEDSEGRRELPWQRTLPSSALAMPICTAALTTIVPLDSLPKYQRSNYISKLNPSKDEKSNDDKDDQNDDKNTLVEIRISDLLSTSSEEKQQQQQQNNLVQRPLAGNLSSKLVDYTRGQVGNRRPFKPGGLTDEDNDYTQGIGAGVNNKNDANGIENDYEPFCSPAEIQNALDAIKKGSIASWKDGTLITAPPGLSFKIGLSPNNDIGDKGCDALEETKEGYTNDGGDDSDNDDNNLENKGVNVIENSTRWFSRSTSKSSVSKMWDKSYFEEDSLFGDDSSSEESSSSSDDDDDEEEGEEEGEGDGDETEEEIDNEIEADEEEKDDNADVDDIDTFLSELEVSKTSNQVMTGKQKKSITFMNRILSVNKAKERKCWAVTTSLNLNDFHSVVPNPAITYPFELDGFQKQAVARLERGECIFVAAHTSAGKTVCAEYAVALARKHCTRAIYTSPIKALSNQKYRDFKDKFGDDVGLITGDLQINADSSCLIMTTEILRSMLYRGADLIRDIEWVIFDEVHYINDSERGVVWEEVIIMLPDYVNMIFLSATTPNTIDFSDWIGRTKRKPVHVIRTNYRPVPLSHHLYAGLKLHKIMEGNSGFLNKGYSKAANALLPQSEKEKKQQNAKKKGPMGGSKQTSAPSYRKSSGSTQSAWQQSGSRQDWTSLVKFLEREGLMPTVVFSFSKKKCEEIANMLRTLDLNTAVERNTAHAFTIQTMARLSPKDASLPQVLATCEMVKRGIGIHHGGLLPILKEMVEILFSRNLIKVLFATETFAMGVNMPARAVVFNSIRKHDGSKFRVLEPGEYTQMAGRAGRRGLDKVGTVIMCCFGDEPPPQLVLRQMLTGSSTKLQSQFRLTYNMIMNLLRVEDMTVEGMIKRSFSEFATQRALTNNDYPKLLKRGMKALSKLDKQFEQNEDLRRGGSEDIEEYFHTSSALLSSNKEALSYLIGCAGPMGGGALVAGRIILVTAARKKGIVKAPAIIVKAPVVSGNANDISNTHLVCMVLCPKTYKKPMDDNQNKVKEGTLNFVGESKNRYYMIKRVELDEILYVTSLKHKIDASKLYSESSGKKTLNTFGNARPVKKVHDFGSFAGMKPLGKKGGKEKGNLGGNEDQLVDQVIGHLKDAEENEMNLEVADLSECTKGARQGDEAFQFNALSKRIVELVNILRSFQSHNAQDLCDNFVTVERKETLRRDIETLRHLLSNESLQLFPDFLQRKSLLRTLNYIDENDTVCVKGRVACEVNTCEEIIVTELIFEGILNELEPPEIVAVLSALIFQEKTTDSELDSELPERLRSACERMKKIALNLGELQSNHGIQLVAKDYCENSLKFGLVHVVYEWAKGVPFKNICELTLVQEGSIVRTITRLDELCREVRNCSRIVGNPILYRKMEEASVAIKRDIVFASSLYLT